MIALDDLVGIKEWHIFNKIFHFGYRLFWLRIGAIGRPVEFRLRMCNPSLSSSRLLFLVGESIFYDFGFAFYWVKLWTSNWRMWWRSLVVEMRWFFKFSLWLALDPCQKGLTQGRWRDNTRHHSKVITTLTWWLRVTSIMQSYME